MSAFIDITGQTFGRWTVLHRHPSEKKSAQWLCRCSCGTERVVFGFMLRNGKSSSCGCASAKNLTGQRFGHLVVLSKTDERRSNAVVFLCRCDCGNEHRVRGAILTNGQVGSCGCQQLSGIAAGPPELADISGQQFAMLHVERFAYSLNGSRYWECRCSCGGVATVRGKDLVHGNTKSCGCLNWELLRPERPCVPADQR